MLLKRSTIALLVLAVVTAMVVEWQYFAVTREAAVVREFHGLCNRGVGKPYVEFIHRLRALDESGDRAALGRALHHADEHSHDIYDVWLARKSSTFQESTESSLK